MFKLLNLNPESFGLDINDSSLKIVKARRKFGLLRPVSFGERKLNPGIIVEGLIKDEDALAKEIKELANSTKGERLGTKYAVVSLPEEKSFFQVIQMPRMEKEELKSAIVFEAENYIPMPADRMYLDFCIVDPIVDHLDHLDVLIVATEKAMVDSYVSCVKKAGFLPVAFESEAQSVVRSLIKDETSPIPVAIADLGGDRTDLIVFAGRSIRFTCSIPISSKQITDEIAKQAGIATDQAEKIKTQQGISGQAEKPVTQVLEKLSEEIKKYLDFYLTHDSHTHLHLPKDAGVEKVILSGGGAGLKGVDEFLKQKLGIPVEFGNPLINFSPKLKHIGLPELEARPLAFATAIGLALRKPNLERK